MFRGLQMRPVQANAPSIMTPITRPRWGKRQAGISLRERETPNCFAGDVSDTTPAFAHATNTAAFDATEQYCTRDIVFFWQPPS